MSSIDKEELEVSEKYGDLRYVPGSEAEKRLVRKLDLRIVSGRASTSPPFLSSSPLASGPSYLDTLCNVIPGQGKHWYVPSGPLAIALESYQAVRQCGGWWHAAVLAHHRLAILHHPSRLLRTYAHLS